MSNKKLAKNFRIKYKNNRVPLNPVNMMSLSGHFKRNNIPNSPPSSVTREQFEVLEQIIPGFNTSPNFSNLFEAQQVSANYEVAAAYANMYTKVNTNKDFIRNEVDKVAEHYLVSAIIDQLIEDSLMPSSEDGSIFKISSKKSKFNKELKILQDRIDLNTLVRETMPEVVKYGEYTLKTSTVKKGISTNPDTSNEYGLIKLMDSVDQSDVLAITENGKITSYISVSRGGITNNYSNILRHKPYEFVRFSFGYRKVKIDDSKRWENLDDNSRRILAKLPRHIRIGKSIIFPIIKQLRALELLEELVPATKLSALSAGTVIGIQMTPGTSPTDAIDICNKIESNINRKLAVNREGNGISLHEILTNTGRLKAIPMYGERGQFQNMDFKSPEVDDLTNDIENYRKTIMSSIGIPYEMIFGGDSGTSKGEILKRFARYLRLCKNIRKCASDAIYTICKIHLINSGFEDEEIRQEDLVIDYNDDILEIESLESLELLDTTVSLADNIKNFLFELNSSKEMEGLVNFKKFSEFLNEHLHKVGLVNIIDTKRLKNEFSIPDEESDKEGEYDTEDGKEPENPEPEGTEEKQNI